MNVNYNPAFVDISFYCPNVDQWFNRVKSICQHIEIYFPEFKHCHIADPNHKARTYFVAGIEVEDGTDKAKRVILKDRDAYIKQAINDKTICLNLQAGQALHGNCFYLGLSIHSSNWNIISASSVTLRIPSNRLTPLQTMKFIFDICELMNAFHCSFFSGSAIVMETILTSRRNPQVVKELKYWTTNFFKSSQLLRLPILEQDYRKFPNILKPWQLGWFNYWSKETAEYLKLSGNNHKQWMEKCQYHPSGACTFNLTDDEFDITNEEHIETLINAYQVFDNIGVRKSRNTSEI